MSKSVRFKLSAPEEKYVIGTINALRNAGIDRGSLPDIAKSSLLEFCVGINKRAKEYNERVLAEQEQEQEKENVDEDAEGSNGSGTVSGTVRSDEVEEQKDVSTASEGEG